MDKFDQKYLEEILGIKDPIELHGLVNDLFEEAKHLEKSSKDDPEGAAQAFNLLVSTASFLESRAVYFLLQKEKEK